METQLKNPLDPVTKALIRKEIEDNFQDFLFEKFWKELFYFSTFFESIDGWSLLNTGITSGILSTSVRLITGSTTGQASGISKLPETVDGLFTYNEVSGFRSSFILGVAAGNNSAVEFSIGIGSCISANSATVKHYGFRLVNSTLYGVVGNGSTETLVTVLTGIAVDTIYEIEARLYSGRKAVFSVSDGNNKKLKERGAINRELPVGDITVSWIEIQIKTTENAPKEVFIDHFEYIQHRPKF